MIFKDRFLNNSILMFVTTSFVSFANLLYQMLVVRNLSVAEYGAFNSLLSIFVILSFPLTSLNTLIAKYVSAYYNTGRIKQVSALGAVMMKQMLSFGILFLICYLFFGRYIKHYLQLSSLVPVYLVAGLLFLTIISTVTLATLQGLERFKWFSACNMAGGILKLGLSFFMIAAGWGIIGALTGFLIAQAAVLIISILPLKKIAVSVKGVETAGSEELKLKEKYMFVMPAMATIGCISLLTNMDIILVRHFFDPAIAGNYSVAQMVGKIALFIPAAIYLVVIPHASGLHARQADPRGVLKKALGYTAFLSLFFLAVYNLFPDLILKLLCGRSNADIVFLGRLFSVTMTLFSFSIVIAFYQLSVSRFNFIPGLLLLSLLQAVLILFFHGSLTQVLFIMTVNSAVLFLALLYPALKR